MATVIAKRTVRVAGDSRPRTIVQAGQTYDSKDQVVKDHPWLFETADERAERLQPHRNTADLGRASMSSRNVEQATAAPGEQRQERYYCDVDGCRSWSTSEEGLAEHVEEEHGDDE